MLIGRLTRDPEGIANGKGAKFGFAVNNRQLDNGEWKDVPVFLDCEVWNRGDTGKQADLALQSLRKGSRVFIEGKLKMDSWADKNDGTKRTAIRITVDNFQFLDPKNDGETRQPQRQRPAASDGDAYDGFAAPRRAGAAMTEEEIPF